MLPKQTVCVPTTSSQIKNSLKWGLCSYQLGAEIHNKSFCYANVSEHISDCSFTCHDLIITPAHNISISMAFFLEKSGEVHVMHVYYLITIVVMFQLIFLLNSAKEISFMHFF